MGIIHGEAGYLPDFLEYFSTGFSSAPVKIEILGKKDIETTTMANFYSQVSGRDRLVGENGRRASGARLILDAKRQTVPRRRRAFALLSAAFEHCNCPVVLCHSCKRGFEGYKPLSCSDKDEELVRQEVMRMHKSVLMRSWIVVAQ